MYPSMKIFPFINSRNDFLISFSMECMIVKFDRPCDLMCKQKAEIILEGNLDLGNLIILPTNINIAFGNQRFDISDVVKILLNGEISNLFNYYNSPLQI